MTLTTEIIGNFTGTEAAKLAAIEANATKKKTIQILAIMPPATLAPALDVRPGGSTPAEQVKLYDFDDTTIEYLDLLCRMSDSYTGNGLTFDFGWSATSATSGDVEWEAAIRRIADDAEDIDGAHTYLFNAVTSTAPSASGEISNDVITFTNGADMDSVAAGENFILRMRRNAAADDLVGDAELWAGLMVGSET